MSIKQYIDFSRLFRYFIIGGVIIALLIINYRSLSRHMDSNSRFLTAYTIPDDFIERTRPKVTAARFYNDRPDRLRRQALPRPDIFVIPPSGEYTPVVTLKALQMLKAYVPEIKKIIWVDFLPEGLFDGAMVAQGQRFGGIKIADEAAHGWNGLPTAPRHLTAKAQKNVNLEVFKEELPNAGIIPILYGNISGEKLARKLAPFVEKQDNIIVFSADLAAYRNAEKSGVPVYGMSGLDAALILARQYNLTPDVTDLVKAGSLNDNLDYEILTSENAGETEKTPVLEQQRKALEDVRKVYGQELIRAAENALARAIEKKKRYTPSRQEYSDTLFDRGAVFVNISREGGPGVLKGSLNRQRGTVFNLADSVFAATAENKDFADITTDDLPDFEIKIELLTGFMPVSYENEADLLDKLQPGIDGIIIRSGDRQALLLPSEWKDYEDKQAFLNSLKLKAGLNPGYWSNKIKVYRFYTVEIEKK